MARTPGSPRTSGSRSRPGGASVLALLPGAPRDAVERVVGGAVEWCDTPGALVEAIPTDEWKAVLVSLEHPEVDDDLVRRLAEGLAGTPLFVTSRTSSIERVLAAERAGAVAVLPDPPDGEALSREILPLLDEPGELPLAAGAPEGESPIVGSSPALLEVFRVVARAASSSSPVLVTGESGTGKELVARAIHDQGARVSGPFVAVNCAAIPDTLLEAELFGYEKGAFSGAVARSEGRFGRAHRGTLFLDEIGEMSLSLQAKLLRAIESGEVERLGGRESVKVDVRVVAATNRDLRSRVEEGRFREDLLFRLAVVELELPPLRERPADILPLASHFAARFARDHGRRVTALSRRAADALQAHRWPGNVRELRNVVDRAVLLARGGVVRSADLRLGPEAPRTSPPDRGAESGFPPTFSLAEVEARHIRAVLEHTGGHMGRAAEILGIHRNTMTAKVREYGIEVGPKP